MPLFPDNINTFVDLFSGGGNVGINVKANMIICNDILKPVIEFCNTCKELDSIYMTEKIYSLIHKYQLSKTNKEGYLKLREDYNSSNKSWDMFYTLVCHSFSNQIRFNKKSEFNLPFGQRTFNKNLKNNFIIFVDHLKTINIKFTSNDFIELKINKLTSNDFVYCDPPYLITCASYNEQDGWNKEKELKLLSLLDSLNEYNIKFALSNVLESKGKTNKILLKWSKGYRVHELNCTYGNCNYQRKVKDKKDIEVLITNY